MRIHDKTFRTHALLFGIILAVSGCAAVRAPKAMHPAPEALSRFVYGAWTLVRCAKVGAGATVEGELIAIDSTDVVVMAAAGPRRIARSSIEYAEVDVHERDAGTYAAWTALGTLSTISHGWFLTFTAPMWIVGGTVCTVAVGDSGFEARYSPDARWWWERSRFARFPQGLPPGLVLDSLKPYRQLEW